MAAYCECAVYLSVCMWSAGTEVAVQQAVQQAVLTPTTCGLLLFAFDRTMTLRYSAVLI